MAYPQGEQESGEGSLLACFDGVQQVLGTLVAHTLQV